MIQSGKLDRVLELQAPTVIKDELKQEIETFAKVATIYAEALEMRTQDAVRAGGREIYSMARYRVRWRNGLKAGMRVVAEGKVYNILAVDEPDRRMSMIVTLEEATR